MLGPRPRTPALGVQHLAPHINPPAAPPSPHLLGVHFLEFPGGGEE